MDLEKERELFEEEVFKQRFLSSIVRNDEVPQPRISGALDFVSKDCPTKAEFVAKNEDGSYKEATLNPAWWAWQKRAEQAEKDLAWYVDRINETREAYNEALQKLPRGVASLMPQFLSEEEAARLHDIRSEKAGEDADDA